MSASAAEIQKKTCRRISRTATACIVLGFLSSACSKKPPAVQVLWEAGMPGRGPSAPYTPGDVVPDADAVWVAFGDRSGAPHVRVVRAPSGGSPLVLASFEGTAPSLVRRPDGWTLACLQEEGSPSASIVARDGSPDGRTWSTPRALAPAGAWTLANGRLLRTSRGVLLLPAVRLVTFHGLEQEVVCFRSVDEGRSWNAVLVTRAADAAAPVIAESRGGELLLVLRLGNGLARCESRDGGAHWSMFEPLGLLTDATLPHGLESLGNGVALAWTEPRPDSTWAEPPFRALHLSVSSDAGASWQPLAPLAWRSGNVPGSAALAFRSGQLVSLYESRGPHASALTCVAYELRALTPVERTTGRPGGRYAVNPEEASDALQLLCEHIVGRGEPSKRLFIEGYCMRDLVLVDELLRGAGSWPGVPADDSGARKTSLLRSRPRFMDSQYGLVQAVSFADWLLQGQDEAGYWPLGYKAVYVADMAAAVGLFAALAPHVEPARRAAYVASAERFASALERDGMVLESGACGVGWVETRTRSDTSAVRAPYLVSTALAGIEVPAWLAAQTGNPRWRTRALAALDYTLSQLQPDGSFPGIETGESTEGAFVAAAYVQEGWMAADLFLQDAAVLERLRRALPAHVDWLLRTMRPDGTWGSRGADGEWARTPGILDFLIWYDRRCEAREDVRRAVRRASLAWADPGTWHDLGLARAGRNEDVMRALAGRSLAAMAADRPVY